MTLKLRRHNASGLMRGGVMGRRADLLLAGEAALVAELGGQLAELGFSIQHCSSALVRETLASTQFDAVVTTGDSGAPLAAPGLVHVHIGRGAAGSADAVLRAPAHPIQIAARIRALLRLSVIESVARLRLQDAEYAGARVNPGRGPKPVTSVLYVGAPDPAFMRLRHALEGTGTDTIAAFSTFSAFDYLHERAFDAVALNTTPDADLAHTVCSAMRRNTRLYHTPAMLLTRSEVYAGADEAFARGASDILHSNASGDELRERIMGLARERQRRRAAKSILEACRQPSLMDETTDLFGAEFSQAHLTSLIEHGTNVRLPTCFVALSVTTPPSAGDANGQLARNALDQFAGMLRHCVRAEDLAARLGRGLFYLALPATSADDARTVAARVAAIAECTAYEGADPQRPFRVEVSHASCEAQPGDTANSLRQRAFGLIAQRSGHRVAS